MKSVSRVKLPTCQMEYIVIDRNFLIHEISPRVTQFLDPKIPLETGQDIRNYLPELIGMEEVMVDVLNHKQDRLELQGITREKTSELDIYFDIYGLNRQEHPHQDPQLMLFIAEATERMNITQKLGQVAKEYSLALAELSLIHDYFNQVIESMGDILFVITKVGKIKMVNPAALEIFEYPEEELVQQLITLICPGTVADETEGNWAEVLLGHDKEWLCRTKTGKERVVSFSCSRIQTQIADEEDVVCLGRDITKRKEAEIELKRQGERDRLLGSIVEKIRQSLDLDQILQTTVQEVQQFLQCDHVLFYQMHPDQSCTIVAQAISPESDPNSHQGVYTEFHWPTNRAQSYLQGQVFAIDDLETVKLDPATEKILQQFQACAELTLPIRPTEQLWGVLTAYHCGGPRSWEPWEIDLLRRLTDQVAIAIYQAELYQHTQKEAITDSLTQLANRGAFWDCLNFEWIRLARDKSPLSLILCDVDYFKLYNDTYGHLSGDFCLQKIADILREIIKRPADLAARYGGEEFAIILPHTNANGALHVAEKIRHQVKQANIPHRSSVVGNCVTLSLGVMTLIPDQDIDPEELVEGADQALYQAKESGRDRVVTV